MHSKRRQTEWGKRVNAFKIIQWEYLGIIFLSDQFPGKTVLPLIERKE
jgi:hypothetical protein